MESNEEIINTREKKVFEFIKKNKSILVYIALIAIIIYGGIYLRTLNVPQLKDITTNNWTLAPDLDPFLFLRWAKDIAAHGSLMKIDTMRYVPLGFNTADEMTTECYIIADFYKFLHAFSPSMTVEFAAIIYPVIFFCLFLIVLFFFTRTAFSNYKSKDLIALVAILFATVIPGLIHRTVAGVPEKEAAGVFFMILSLFLMTIALKKDRIKPSALFGLLAGITTGLMGFFWGGVAYLFVTIAITFLLIFFFSETKKKEISSYFAWIFGFTAILIWFPRFGLVGLLTSSTSGLAYFVLALYIFDFLVFGTKLKEMLKLDKIKLPEKIMSFIAFTILSLLLLAIVKPDLIANIIGDMTRNVITPFAGDRISVTVAENSRSFFDSWISNFGLPFFWIFILGSVLLVYEMLSKIKLKDRIILTCLYAFFILGLIFSSYSSSSILNGTSIQSIALFIGSTAIFGFYLIRVLLKKEINIDKTMILIAAAFFFSVFTARTSSREFYFLYPIAPILAAFLIIRIPEIALNIKEDMEKVILLLVAGAIIVLAVFAFINFAQASESDVRYAEVPNHYQFQWQQAMAWVRENTSTDAVFAHWWDYGYWVQTMGERATVLDGGNVIGYWDYLMGRHVLTAQNETEALEFLKTHKATHLLIDSSDIGKYPAYSSIGSDENYDRYSWISTFSMDTQSTQEKRNETIYLFKGGAMLDDDIIWKGQIYPQAQAGIGAIILPMKNIGIENYSVSTLEQPIIIMMYQNKQTEIPIKCVYIEGEGKKIYFNESGIDGCFYIIPTIDSSNINKIGAGFWLSKRLMNSLMVKLYLLNETENFELVHSQNDPIIDEINSKYNLNLPEMVIYGNAGLLGPIKIWQINYPENIQENPEYLKTDYPNKNLTEVKR